MIIEYFGLPGSGKTFLAKRLAFEKNIPLIELRGRIERFFYALVFFVLHPYTNFFLLKKIFAETWSRKELLWHKVILIFPTAIANEQKARFTRSDCIIDQGLLQLLLGVYEHKVSFQGIERILKLFRAGNRFVYIVEADRIVREKRMTERGRRVRDHFIIKYGEEYKKQWFEALEHNFALIKKILPKKFKYDVLINNGNERE